MTDLFRESPVGQIVRSITKGRFLKYSEEKDGFLCPNSFTQHPSATSHSGETLDVAEKVEFPTSPGSLSSPTTLADSDPMNEAEKTRTINSLDAEALRRLTSRAEMEKVTTRHDLERAYTAAVQRESLKRGTFQPIVPQKTADGIVLVDWYDTDDQDNPQNWSSKKKAVVATQIFSYTLAVYMGSAIYTPSEPFVQKQFGVSPAAASLGLALYVLGYGTGPLIFAPLSEIPIIGRNPPYMATFGIFVVLCVPTALVNNFAAFLVLRFLQGFFGSPCLATGGASLGDLYSLLKLPYSLTIWAAFATCGPAMGPIISGFSVPAKNWHWSLWEILWIAGPVFIIMMLFLPETSSSNILLRRAARLRKLTNNPNLKSQAEIDRSKLSFSAIAYESLFRPWQVMFLDPAVLFTNLYTALVYCIYYSFFEVFPIVYIGFYGFNLGEMGLTFLSISISVGLAIPCYYAYLYYLVEPEIKKNGIGAPEGSLIPALFVSFLLPIGLFMFGWTANPHIHWIVSLIGVTIFGFGVFILLQCIFMYIPLSYPQFAASLFAANDFARSALASGAILFARPLYLNLGVGQGISLLAGLTVGCIGGIFGLYFFGAKLRARSKFTAK